MKRFSECWQALADYPGTGRQREMVEEAYHLDYGTNKHKYFKLLDREINRLGRSYLTFGFLPDDMFPPNYLAIAGRTGINMRASTHPSAVYDQALHEVVHVGDYMGITTAAGRLRFMELAGIDPNQNTWNHNVQETYADAGKECLKRTGWSALWPIMLGEV